MRTTFLIISLIWHERNTRFVFKVQVRTCFKLGSAISCKSSRSMKEFSQKSFQKMARCWDCTMYGHNLPSPWNLRTICFQKPSPSSPKKVETPNSSSWSNHALLKHRLCILSGCTLCNTQVSGQIFGSVDSPTWKGLNQSGSSTTKKVLFSLYMIQWYFSPADPPKI